MLYILVLLAIAPIVILAQNKHLNEQKTLLCLGDSYTIGEAVGESQRFPEQLVKMLAQYHIYFQHPQIIAKTGWTTDELAAAVAAWEKEHPNRKFDAVTLLIGVNNQYRGRDTANYRTEFKQLLTTAIHYAGTPGHVFVVSIPDWGVTPFAAKQYEVRSEQQIAHEIDAYNEVNRQEAIMAGAHYTEITQHSRLAKHNADWIAGDGLHPSPLMYQEWAKRLSQIFVEVWKK